MWSNNYIGIPFKEKGRDRSGADCWGLVRLIYKEQYNIDLPSFAHEYPTVDDRARIHELIAQYKEAWSPVEAPSEGSVVLFRIMGSETHIGVAINEQEFIHVREGSDSAIERFDSATWKDRLIGHFSYSTNKSAILNAVPHPLQTQRYTVPVPQGTTLDSLADWIVKEWKVAPELKSKVTILVNGSVVPQDMWAMTVLKDTDQIDYRAVPTGSAGRLIAMIAIAVVAPYIAASLIQGTLITSAAALTATGLVGTVGFTALTVGVSLLGSALVNAIFPVRPPAEPKDPGSSERQLMMTGGANQANPYGAIPLVLGKVKMTPPLGATNYMTFANERDSYLSMMLAWGYGPLVVDLSTLKVGDVSYTDFEFAKFGDGSNMLVTLDRQNDTQANIDKFNTIYGKDVFQVQSNIELICDGNPENSGQTISGTSTTDGYNNTTLSAAFSGRPTGGTVEVTISSSENISTWNISTSGISNVVISTIDLKTKKITGTAANTTPTVTATATAGGTASYTGYAAGTLSPGIWQEAATTGKCREVTVALHFPQGLRKIKSKGEGAGDSYTAPVGIDMEYKLGAGSWTTWQHVNVGSDAYKKDAFTVTYTKTFDSEITGGVQVRVRRTTGDNTEDNPDWRYYHQVVFLATSFTNNDSPAVDPKNCKIAKTALRLKASEQFNGSIQGINAIVQTYCMAYNGSSWAMAATNNPADLFRYVLQHPANPQRITDAELSEKINLTQLQYWWSYCNQSRSYTDPDTNLTTTYKLTYNAVIAEARSVLDVLRDICAAGRASPAMIDGKWTVIIDEPRTSTIQHFTPHNSWGFEGTRALPKIPDGLRITYFDEDQNYQQVETIVYKTGKDQTTAELFESIDLPGVTKREMVIDHARWHMAQGHLRRESYVLNTDIEYIVCNRGDRVKVTHDVPMWGLGSGRIKNRINAQIFDIDEPVDIDDATNYTIRVRSSNGASIERTLQKSFTITYAQRLANKVTITTSTQHPLQIGDRVTVASNITAINGTFTITDIGSTTFSYDMIATNIAGQGASGTATLADGTYSRIMVTVSTTAAEVAAGDLFLFGLYQQESQDLIVLNVEPSTNKTARLTLVDYGVTNTYNIFNDYKTLTSNTVFNTGINLPPALNRNLYSATDKPTITGLSSDESAADLSAPGSYTYRLRVAFANTVDNLAPTTVSVECQYDVATATTSANYKSIMVDYRSGNVYIPNVIAGQSYKARLRYVSSEGASGPWTNWYNTTIFGKTIAPSTPTNFTYTLKETGIQFKWDPSTDVDYSTTTVKVLSFPLTNGLTGQGQTPAQVFAILDAASASSKLNNWNSATKLFEGNADTWTWTKPSSGAHYVMIRHKDSSDNISTTYASLNINYTDLVLASVQIDLSNPVPVIPFLPNTTTAVLTNSGTQISVLQGGTALRYDGVGTASGRWKIDSVTASSGITKGDLTAVTDATNGDAFATIGDIKAFSATSSATITYVISGKTTLGSAFTITRVHTYYTVKPSNTASIVYAYKRSASAPTDNPGAVTYDFLSASITTPAALANSWSKVITAGTDPLWVTTAAASSNTGTDSIAATEWSTPVQYAANGLNTAIVRLYARNSSTTTAPAKATTGDSTYTFSTGVVSGQPNGWSQTIPAESNGNVIWTIQATATNTADTDTIANTEWSTPVEYGRQGDPGISSAVVYVYKRAVNQPPDTTQVDTYGNVIVAADRPGAVTYSFSTNQITTAESSMNGWKKQAYAGTDPLWVRAATAASNSATDTIADTEWSSAIKYVENGLNTATVFLYARNNSTSTPPTLTRYVGWLNITSTYTFSSGALASPPTGWSRSIPDASNGSTIWVIQATAANTTSTDYIYGSEWSTPVILTQQGVKGDQGPRSAYGYVYYSVAQAAAPSTPTATNYDFDTGAFTELSTSWSTSINVGAVAENNANQKYWASKFTVSEASYGGTKTISFSTPTTHLNLSGIVTFTNLENGTNSSATDATIIDGAAIKTGTIDADRITANQLFVGHKLQDSATNPSFVINFKDKFISISV